MSDNFTNSNSVVATLTTDILKKMEDDMRRMSLTPPGLNKSPNRSHAENGLFNPFASNSLGGMRIYEEPPPPPKIQVRDIKLKDGTSILSQEFRDKMNAELIAQFGYRESLCGDNTAYILGNYGLVMSSRAAYDVRQIINWSAT